MRTTAEGRDQWFVLGFLAHLVLLVVLFCLMKSVPDSWRGRVLVEGQPGGAPWGAGGPAVREVRLYDATLMGLMALASVVATMIVAWQMWNRRRWFTVGFMIPAAWSIIYLLK